jgi:hypothetical protein
MSTTPPEEHQPQQPAGGPASGAGYGYGPRSGPMINIGGTMPTPGNAELVVLVLASIILAIVALASDGYDAHGWAVTFGWITAAYLISRGIAKASRVLER